MADGGEWGMFVVLTMFMAIAAILIPSIGSEFGHATDTIGQINPSDISETSLMSIGASMWSMFSPVWSYFGVFPASIILIHVVIKIIWYILLIRLIILPIVEAIGSWIPFA
jgi:hypothetical protein